jgi:hypothetical protein
MQERLAKPSSALERPLMSQSWNLPLQLPEGLAEPGRAGTPSSMTVPVLLEAADSLESIRALFPELLLTESGSSALSAFQVTTLDASGRLLEALPPAQAGSGYWSFVAFAVDEAGVGEVYEDPFSTLQPLRIGLAGPPWMATGDVGELSLRIANASDSIQSIQFSSEATGAALLEGEKRLAVNLGPGSEREIRPSVRATKAGQAQIDVRLETSGQVQELAHPLQVLGDGKRTCFTIKRYTGSVESFEFEHQAGAKVTFCSGWGPLLQLLLGPVKEANLEVSPLLTRLAEWVLTATQSTSDLSSLEEHFSTIEVLLEERMEADGQLSWYAGSRGHRRLTAAVLSTLTRFLPSDQVSAIHETDTEVLRAALEQTLLKDLDSSESDRLIALRALSVPRSGAFERRPTRLSARVFLELFLTRDLLSLQDRALLLQVARNFGFTEEVSLLVDELKTTLESIDPGDLEWTLLAELRLSLADLPNPIREAVHEGLMEALSHNVDFRGWPALEAYLALCACYQQEGDFSERGRLDVTLVDPTTSSKKLSWPSGAIGSERLLEVPEAVVHASRGLLKGRLQLEPGASPVTVIQQYEAPDPTLPALNKPEDLTVEVVWERRRLVPTLLSGAIFVEDTLGQSEGGELQTGDEVRLLIEFPNTPDELLAHLEIEVPFALELESEQLEGSLRRRPGIAEKPQRIRYQLQTSTDNPVSLDLRFTTLWRGSSELKPILLHFPEEGSSYHLGERLPLSIR